MADLPGADLDLAEHYPWAVDARACVLTAAREWPVRPERGCGMGAARVADALTVDEFLEREGAAPIADRTLVVAIGSNASPAVIARKYASGGCGWATPFATGTLHGVAVGHSAHVAPRGYIPAAPFARATAVTRVVASWFDEEQLAVVDATERNYARRELDAQRHPLVLESGERPPYSVYVSRHGLIGDRLRSAPVGLGTQSAILAHLSAATSEADFAGDAADVCRRLAEPGAAVRATAALQEGPTVAHGLT
ncbi:hypothetical protein [Agromyces sp. SYSU T00194]|uniref:hypothetical protein n=1 Tax=Agromyces chitinivorans TaxID=3158560 RepID=UPI003397A77A